MAGNVARVGDKRNAYMDLEGKPGGKRQRGRSRSRWEDNINVDLKGIGWGWLGLK
jgi:hypothetical protein